MKIIIYGASEMSLMLAKELYEVHDVTVIAHNEEIPEELNKLDISYVPGNGANLNVLETAQINTADVFIASSNIDESNIVSSWIAKRMSNIETVCFVSRFDYLECFHLSKNVLKGKDSEIDHIIWPEELLTQEISRIITVPEAIDVEIFAGGKARLLEYRIKEDSIILDKYIKDCFFPEGALVVGITRDNKLFIPDGSTQFHLNDKVIFMGTEQGLNNLGVNFFETRKKTKNVTIIGGGSVGYMLAVDMEKMNIKTKIIETTEARSQYLSDNLKKALVIKGDGTDLELLESEDIGDCDVLVSVTNNDEKNLLCSLLAKQLGVKKVITRVNKAANVNLFEKVGIDVAISPKEAALKEIRDRLLEKDVDILALVERGQGEVIEISVPENFVDKKIMELNLPVKAIISAIKRGSKILIPKGNTSLRGEDNLMIFTIAENAPKIKEYFKNIFARSK